MRYRGGGVGHLYMRGIEIWLAETGWGSNDTPITTDGDVSSEEGSEDSDSDDGNDDGEVSEDAVSNGAIGSDEEHGPDMDLDAEYLFSENEEETMDGEYGFSSL